MLIRYGRMSHCLALLAMLGASWAYVDMHQHERGIHKPASCSVCSLEDAVSHGFTPQSNIRVLALQIDVPDQLWQERQYRPACIHSHAIRAPPTA